MIIARYIIAFMVLDLPRSESIRMRYRKFTDVMVPATTVSTITPTTVSCCQFCSTRTTCTSVRYDSTSQICEESSSPLLISPYPLSSSRAVYSTGSSIYELVKVLMTWEYAKSNCEANGGQLIKIESDDEQGQLKSWVAAHGHNPDPSSIKGPWIGLNDIAKEDMFKWADGSSAGAYTNWGDGQPDNNGDEEDCVSILYPDSSWNDYKCFRQLWSVCEYN